MKRNNLYKETNLGNILIFYVSHSNNVKTINRQYISLPDMNRRRFFLICISRHMLINLKHYTVDSRYLEVEGTL